MNSSHETVGGQWTCFRRH